MPCVSALPTSLDLNISYVDDSSLAVEDLVRQTLLHRTIADNINDISDPAIVIPRSLLRGFFDR